MSTKFILTRDINGYNGFGIPFGRPNQLTDIVDTTLAQNTTQSTTVPNNNEYWLAVFSYQTGSTVFVANNDTAAVPGSSFASTTSEMNPSARQVKGGDVLSFITPDTNAYVSVAFYVIQPYM